MRQGQGKTAKRGEKGTKGIEQKSKGAAASKEKQKRAKTSDAMPRLTLRWLLGVHWI